jgi:endonuclease G, mitochondrial
MATPGKRKDAPKGVTVDEGTVGRRGATAAAQDAPATVARDALSSGSPPIVIGAAAGTTVRIEITITTAPPPPTVPSSIVTTDTIERNVQPWHDESYGDRKGYDAGFLDVRVPMPRATSSRLVARQENGTGVLPYQHFSIVMHRSRRLALCTAANLDFRPRQLRPDPTKSYSRSALGGLGENDREVWFTDPRLPAAHQLSDRFYSRDNGAFDRGHVVMRESIAWGTTYTMLRRANGDSYHITNCTPQVKGFNQASQQGRWGKLENAIAKQGKGERVSVFSGAVLSDDDWWFEGEEEDGRPLRLQIPSRFWKVVVGVSDDGALVAYGFLLTQDLDRVPLSEEFGFDASAWRDEFVSIADIARAAKLVRFPEVVVRADQFGRTGEQELARMLERA